MTDKYIVYFNNCTYDSTQHGCKVNNLSVQVLRSYSQSDPDVYGQIAFKNILVDTQCNPSQVARALRDLADAVEKIS